MVILPSNILDLLPSTIMPDKSTLDSTKPLTDAEDILYQESILSKCLSFVRSTSRREFYLK